MTFHSRNRKTLRSILCFLLIFSMMLSMTAFAEESSLPIRTGARGKFAKTDTVVDTFTKAGQEETANVAVENGTEQEEAEEQPVDENGQPVIVPRKATYIKSVTSDYNPTIYKYDTDMALTIAYKFLMEDMGMNQAAAAGVITNFLSESGIRTTALGDAGTSYGLCQWHNERWLKLQDFAKMYGKPMEDIDTQLNFFRYEIRTEFPELLNEMMTVEDTVDGAKKIAYLMCLDFERPANTEATSEARSSYAKSTYERGFSEYNCSPTMMQVLYMLTIYSQNFTSPEILISKTQGFIKPEQEQGTYISNPGAYSSFMLDGMMDKSLGTGSSIQPWIQTVSLDELPVQDVNPFTGQPNEFVPQEENYEPAWEAMPEEQPAEQQEAVSFEEQVIVEEPAAETEVPAEQNQPIGE